MGGAPIAQERDLAHKEFVVLVLCILHIIMKWASISGNRCPSVMQAMCLPFLPTLKRRLTR